MAHRAAQKPFLKEGQPLAAADAVRLTHHLRRHPGMWVLLRPPTRSGERRSLVLTRRTLGPDYVVRGDPDGSVYVRARITGEPARPYVRRPDQHDDLTGEWLTVRGAMELVGTRSLRWFRSRYIRSGLLPVHRTGRGEQYVRRVDAERVADMRAGGVLARSAGWPDERPVDYDPDDPDRMTADAVRRGRDRVGG